VGSGRSGTTAIRTALLWHPLVMNPERNRESPLLDRLGELAWTYAAGEHADYYTRTTSIPKPQMLEYLARIGFESVFGWPHGWPAFRFRLAQRRDKSVLRKTAWTAKVFPSAREPAEGLRLLYPAARFVYIVRNGASNVESRMKFRGHKVLGFETNCEIWARNWREYRYLLDYPGTVVVRQEDLVEDPKAQIDRVLQLAGLPSHDAPWRFLAGNLVHPQDKKSTPAAVKTEFRQRPAPGASWSAHERSTFAAICGEAMVDAGYAMPS
jgi:hypothetical protein